MLNSYKDRQFLVFEFDDGKSVKYNLATGECIGKSGKPVNNVCTQLRGYNLYEVIESFKDEKYRHFLNFVDDKVNRVDRNCYYSKGSKVRNIGTFLLRIKKYSDYEQFFSSGIKRVSHPLYTSFNEIPKGLIKTCREYDIQMCNKLIYSYFKHADLFINLLNILEDLNTITKDNIIDLIKSDSEYGYAFTANYKIRFMELINNYNYNPKSLIKYIDNLMTYEAFNYFDQLMNEFYDYVKMMDEITDKYEKYPRNFLTTHQIAIRNYSRMKKAYDEQKFISKIDKKLEYEYKDYKIIYPSCTQEIKEEGVKLNHCVASYIDKVIKGETHILFLRRKDSLDNNLLTLEVRRDSVVQARGVYNRPPTDIENKIIDRYNKKLKKIKKETAIC